MNQKIIKEKLSLQKEGEKQILINKLDGMGRDERFIYTQLQQYGVSDWYKESEEANMKAAEIDTGDDTNLGDSNSEKEGYSGTDVDGGGGDEGDGGDGGWDNDE